MNYEKHFFYPFSKHKMLWILMHINEVKINIMNASHCQRPWVSFLIFVWLLFSVCFGGGGRFCVYCPNIWRIKYIPISSDFGSCWNGITQYSLNIRVVYMWVLKSLLRNSDMIFWMFYSILLRITELNKLVSLHSCEFYLLSMQNNSLYHSNCICLALYIFFPDINIVTPILSFIFNILSSLFYVKLWQIAIIGFWCVLKQIWDKLSFNEGISSGSI